MPNKSVAYDTYRPTIIRMLSRIAKQFVLCVNLRSKLILLYIELLNKSVGWFINLLNKISYIKHITAEQISQMVYIFASQ